MVGPSEGQRGGQEGQSGGREGGEEEVELDGEHGVELWVVGEGWVAGAGEDGFEGGVEGEQIGRQRVSRGEQGARCVESFGSERGGDGGDEALVRVHWLAAVGAV